MQFESFHWLSHHGIWYNSFKIFPRFWLVKTARMIHHNQLLLTKFAKNFVSTDDVKSAARCRLLNHWRQNDVKSLDYWTIDVKEYWTIDQENLATRLCYLTKSEMAESRFTSLSEEIFWMNNKAVIEFGFRRIWRILQISTCRILHILLSLFQ